jgi:hypothetical protein
MIKDSKTALFSSLNLMNKNDCESSISPPSNYIPESIYQCSDEGESFTREKT